MTVEVQECLVILLRGQHPVIVCPARSVEGMRLPAAWKAALTAGRMLVISPFVVQASCLRKRIQGSGKSRLEARTTTSRPLWTLDDPANAHLVALGAQFLSVADVPARLGLQGTRP